MIEKLKETEYAIKRIISYNLLKKSGFKLRKKYLKRNYKKRTGYDFDIENPNTYTEKMQYSKLYFNEPIKTQLSDKLLVRKWIDEKIGSEYLIPILGTWEKFSDIQFDLLPNKFVLKTNHGFGTNMIINDKDNLNYKQTKRKFDKWLKTNFAFKEDLQLHYEDISPRIYAEKLISDSEGNLNDYKFMCFNGKVFYVWVDVGRNRHHYRNVYDLNWNLQPWNQHTYKNSPNEVIKPKNFNKMIELATALCQDFSHVRVDFYNVDGKIYFGEMTFTNGGGYQLIKPEKYNYMLGDLWTL